MSSDRLRSSLCHSIPKPPSRPPPLWQIATSLDTRAVPTAATDREPATSAVPAGWICVGIGMLTAWFFPLAHVFFSIAFILSIVAMATHQVRRGLLLLAGSLAGSVVCFVLFVGGIAMLVAGALHPTPKPRLELASRPQPAPAVRPMTPAVNFSHAAALTDVLNLLAADRREEEILAFAAGRIAPGQIGRSEITSLRAYGASERLIDGLRRLSAQGGSSIAQTYPAPPAEFTWTSDSAPAISATPFPAPPAAMSAPPAPMPTPVDYAARDRRIAGLQEQIGEIDETIRRVRADPHWYGIVRRSTDTSRQQASDAYLDQLDKQRNDLRREKWRLEGR